MAQHRLRFAHAAELRLDAPLRGVGPLSPAARRIAESAPTVAWQRLVAACIERDVAFLLLTPRTLVGAALPPDRRALLDGFAQLADRGIPVYWALAAGEDIADQWPGALPDNVTVLDRSSAPARLIRDGRAVAVISVGRVAGASSPPQSQDAATTTSEPPLRITVPDEPHALDELPAAPADEPHASSPMSPAGTRQDYVACWGAPRLHTRKVGSTLWTDPGCLLGRSADEQGGGGCCIVDAEAGRIIDVLRVPTAPVRWERCLLSVTAESTREDLIERLQFLLLEREPAIGEQLWIIDWHVVGSGPVIELLQQPAARAEIETAVESAFGDGDRLIRVQRWELRSRSTNAADDHVSLRMQEWLDEQAAATWPSLCLEVDTELRRANCAAAAGRTADLRPAAVREEAERLLSGWLAIPARDAG